jgi:hypothetical protein
MQLTALMAFLMDLLKRLFNGLPKRKKAFQATFMRRVLTTL